MKWTDRLVALRHGALNTLLRIDDKVVLNPYPPSQPALKNTHIAAEIKRAVNAFKATAMDPTRSHVDYGRLQEGTAYSEYRRTCTPYLRVFDPATLTTQAVITFGVRRSVTEGLVGVLRFFRRATYNVGGQRYSLEDIEHGVLRANRGHPYLPGPQFGPSDPRRAFVVAPLDPRLHFALNCASRSCPPIDVYTSEALDNQLDLAARNFVSAETTIDPARNEVHLSAIFRWYAGDFKDVVGSLLRYLPESEDRQWLAAHHDTVHLAHHPYNWSLYIRVHG